MDILEKIQPIFRDVFDDETIVVHEGTKAADIQDWDSFAQIQIVTGIEALFHIKFSTDEVTGFENVGNVVDAIKRHIG